MFARYFSATFLACILALAAKPQPYIYDELEASVKESFPDEPFVFYESNDYYSFNTSSSKEYPLACRRNSERIIVNLVNLNPVIRESSNSKSTIRYVDAKSFNEKGKEVREDHSFSTKQYETNGIFHDDFYVNTLFPYYKKKGVVKLTYSKLFEDYKFLTTVPIFPNYPTKNSHVEIEVPDYLDLEIREWNFDGYEIKSTVESVGDSKVYKYDYSGIHKNESCYLCPSSRYYEPHLIIIYKSISKRNKEIRLMPNTESLYGWYKSLIDQMEDNPAEISDLVDKFDAMPKGEEQIKAVNDWVKSNIRYIAFEKGIAGFKPETCQNVYKNRYGDCKGMANLCRNVLLELGYDARLAWIGTRKEVPYDYSIPSLSVDNHMITAVKMEDGQFIYLDPTESYGNSLKYAFRIQGRPVLIEDGDSFIISEVPTSDLESDKIIRNYKVVFDYENVVNQYSVNESLKGEPSKGVLAGYSNLLASDREKALIDYLRPYDTGSFSLLEFKGLDAEKEELSFSYEFVSREGIVDLSDEYYIDVDPTTDLEYAEVDKERKANWFFNERYNRKTLIEFEAPEDFKISHYPKGFASKTDDFEIQLLTENEGNKLKIQKSIVIYNGDISNSNKEQFESALNKLKSYYEDRVIITRDK